jgi:hypothetical protein
MLEYSVNREKKNILPVHGEFQLSCTMLVSNNDENCTRYSHKLTSYETLKHCNITAVYA